LSKKPGLAQRTMDSISWNIVASLTLVVVGFVRSVLLARWLPVEVFGVYTLARSIVALTAPLTSFGMGGAYLHRAPETENEDRAAAVHFTLKLAFTTGWLVLLTIGALVFTEGADRMALLVLALARGGIQLAQTPRLILMRRVVHRRLALLQFLSIILSTIIALVLALQGITLWALLSVDLVTLAVTITVLYIWRPVWKPHISWSNRIVHYYLRFGSRTFLATVLSQALDRIDDLWTGIFLGNTALSYYSRAYRFATYPRSILAAPVNKVAGGTYAELKGDRLRLSQAFFRINALLVRSGFWLAGLLALVAPEFIRLLLGAKWLPMLDAFRLMLVFTLLDPIKATVASLFVAVGNPGQVVRARFVQLAILVAGIFALGPSFGITGVAVAVDIMVVAGMALLLWRARAYVDFSTLRLFAPPGLALALGLGLALAASELLSPASSDWLTGSVKAVVFSCTYGAVLFILERQQLLELVALLRNRFRIDSVRKWT